MIGERINPTGRKKLAAELELGDFSTVERDALEQVACGATVLDINSGAVFSNKMAEDPRYADNNFVEPPLMRDLCARVQALVDVPLCIDSSVPGSTFGGFGNLQRAAFAELCHRRRRAAGSDPAAGQEIQRAGGGHFQRRYRHLGRPRCAFRGRKEDCRTRSGFWHPGA